MNIKNKYIFINKLHTHMKKLNITCNQLILFLAYILTQRT